MSNRNLNGNCLKFPFYSFSSNVQLRYSGFLHLGLALTISGNQRNRKKEREEAREKHVECVMNNNYANIQMWICSVECLCCVCVLFFPPHSYSSSSHFTTNSLLDCSPQKRKKYVLCRTNVEHLWLVNTLLNMCVCARSNVSFFHSKLWRIFFSLSRLFFILSSSEHIKIHSRFSNTLLLF